MDSFRRSLETPSSFEMAFQASSGRELWWREGWKCNFTSFQELNGGKKTLPSLGP